MATAWHQQSRSAGQRSHSQNTPLQGVLGSWYYRQLWWVYCDKATLTKFVSYMNLLCPQLNDAKIFNSSILQIVSRMQYYRSVSFRITSLALGQSCFSWWRHQMETFSALLAIYKGQWHGCLMFSLICTRINGWVNNGEAGDFRRHRAHYDVTVMCMIAPVPMK